MVTRGRRHELQASRLSSVKPRPASRPRRRARTGPIVASSAASFHGGLITMTPQAWRRPSGGIAATVSSARSDFSTPAARSAPGQAVGVFASLDRIPHQIDAGRPFAERRQRGRRRGGQNRRPARKGGSRITRPRRSFAGTIGVERAASHRSDRLGLFGSAADGAPAPRRRPARARRRSRRSWGRSRCAHEQRRAGIVAQHAAAIERPHRGEVGRDQAGRGIRQNGADHAGRCRRAIRRCARLLRDARS